MALKPGAWRRCWRHLWLDEADAKWLVGPDGLARLTERVAHSETRHHGEIRLCIEAALPVTQLLRGLTPRARAVSLFQSLGVTRTRGRNGVLIYLLLADRAIEIVADPDLSAGVDPAAWATLADQLSAQFQLQAYEAGLLAAIERVDKLLVSHCPAAPGEYNPNELPNSPVIL